jgi:hypothetical protein
MKTPKLALAFIAALLVYVHSIGPVYRLTLSDSSPTTVAAIFLIYAPLWKLRMFPQFDLALDWYLRLWNPTDGFSPAIPQ